MEIKCSLTVAANSDEKDLLAKFIASGIPEMEKILEQYSSVYQPIKLSADMYHSDNVVVK